MISINLEKIDPKFRLLTDLLLFSDRKDLDFSEYTDLLLSNYNLHYSYFWDRFTKASEICWDSDFWNHRLKILLSLKNKSFVKSLQNKLEKKIFYLIKFRVNVNYKNSIEYIQYLELCKVKKELNHSFSRIREKFISLPLTINHRKLFKIIESLTPYVFSSLDDYVNLLTLQEKILSAQIKFIIAANNQKLINNKLQIVDFLFNLIKGSNKMLRATAKRTFCELLKDDEIKKLIKDKYNDTFKADLHKLLGYFSLVELNDHHFITFKNIIYIDPSITNDLLDMYCSQLFARDVYNRKANSERLAKLVKSVPEINSKKVLNWLSNNSKNSDIKYFLEIFPDLKKISAFT